MNSNPLLSAIIEELPEHDREMFIERYKQMRGAREAELNRLKKIVNNPDRLLEETDPQLGEYNEAPIGEEFIAPSTMTTGGQSMGSPQQPSPWNLQPIQPPNIPQQEPMDLGGVDIPQQEQQLTPATQEMLEHNHALHNHPYIVAQKRVEGLISPDDFTEADKEAGRQLLRGEVPTANLEEHLLTEGFRALRAERGV